VLAHGEVHQKRLFLEYDSYAIEIGVAGASEEDWRAIQFQRSAVWRIDSGKRFTDMFDCKHVYLTIFKRARSRESATATMIKTPCTPCCTSGEMPSSTIPLPKTAMIRTPTRVLRTPPSPPVSAVPPTTTAVT